MPALHIRCQKGCATPHSTPVHRLQHPDSICCPSTTRLLHMKTILILVLLVVITLVTPLTFAQTAIDGFSADRAAAERRWEEQFRAVPSSQSAREHLRRLTLEPHIAGTKEDYATAVYVRDQLRSYGLPADLKEYDVWLNYPKTPSVLELITTARQRLSTQEAVVPSDPTS